ncbi:MAG TPA: long-chain fatty acid--CoA ligase [Gaiellaceae bacterium]|jgi:long-chain acyl-CoA synthetase|nr:long-chain fatty acid--CoA ligase [Gaiellaceae bacterium]
MATEATTAETPAPHERARARTIGAIWRRASTSGRTGAAYLVQEPGGEWREVSWDDAGRRAEELAHGFLSLGLKKGDTFAILGSTRLEWALVDFALAQIGVVVVPVYPTSAPKDCAYVLDHSGAVGIVVEDEEARERIHGIHGEIPRLRHMLTFGDLDDLAERGREHAREHPDAVAQAAESLEEDDLLMIVYTSGTTGPPKGCMMLHRNYASVVEALEQIELLEGPGETNLLFLPLAHTFAQLVLYAGASVGFTIAFQPDMQRVAESLQAVRPTGMPSVPRIYEKTHAAVTAQFDAATGTKRKLIDWALGVGRQVSRLRQDGRPVPAALALRHRVASKLVFSKVQAKLGGRLRFAISGAAPISVEILEFFHALDVLILEGYGLTETASGCAVNRRDRYRFGTVGPILPGVDVRIADDGEILIRGDNVFAGYYRDEEATRAAIDPDGWLHTGDVGALDDGFLRITDRKKDLIVTAGGKNVAPQNIENALKTSKYVSQALAVGDRRPYVAALVTLDEAEITAWARERGIEGSLPELAAHEEVRALVQGVVDEVNRDRTRFEQVKQFAILPREFSAEHDELTPTLKTRRRNVERNFAAEIESLYS